MITSDPYGISHAERPWAGPTPKRREAVYTYDTPEQIARCESCPLPDCTNCVDTRRRSMKRGAEFMALYDRGLTDRELAAAMGVSKPTVCYHRKRRGLPPNRPGPAADPCPGCKSRAICAGVGGTCGERERFQGL